MREDINQRQNEPFYSEMIDSHSGRLQEYSKLHSNLQIDCGSSRQSHHISNRHKINLQSTIENLNYDLRSAGFKQLEKICFCEANDIEQLTQVIGRMLSESDRIKEKVKDCQKSLREALSQKLQIERQLEEFKLSQTKINESKDFQLKKCEFMLKEFQRKEQIYIKQKESFVKQKRGWGQKEELAKTHARNLEQKMKNLEEKLRKLYKLQKVDYKNSFQINTSILKPQKSFIQKQYEQMVVQTIETHRKNLEEQNSELRYLLRQIFGGLQRLINGFVQQELKKQEIIQLPTTFLNKKGFEDTIKRSLRIISDKISQITLNPSNGNSLSGHQIGQIAKSVTQMKSFYSTWEEINIKRSSIVPSLLGIMRSKEKIERLVEVMDSEQAEANVGENREASIEGYITQKMQYFERQMGKINQMRSQMESLQLELH